jgi:NADPH2:quinone reductase
MQAIQIEEFGGPEVLKITELPVPVPGEDEVLIKVTRAGINFADTHALNDTYAHRMELPLVPGMEVAGTRADTGERVVAITMIGGYAEYAVAPASATFRIAPDVDDESALALLLQGLTAWHLHRTAGNVKPTDSVVVSAAAGGVGSLAVQLCKFLGAGRIIATASSPEKREVALSLGADVAVDNGAEGLTDRLVEANGGAPVDVIFDMSGGDVFDASYRALANRGRIVSYGIATMEPNSPSTSSLLRHSRTVSGFYLLHLLDDPMQFSEVLDKLFGMTARGDLCVIRGGTYSLESAADAHRDLRGRRTTGKLYLDPLA